MDWDKVKGQAKDLKDKAANNYYIASKHTDAVVRPSHLVLCFIVLFLAQMCTSTPTVRIILENNGSPVIVKQIKTSKVVHKEPVVTKTSAKVLINPIAPTDGKFQVGDCLANEDIAEKIESNQSLEEWEKDAIGYDKVTGVGKIKYKYISWFKDHWMDIEYTYNKKSIDIIRVKVKCPDDA